MTINVEEFLKDKEQRIILQNKLMDEYCIPAVFMKVRYPGLSKNNILTNNIIREMEQLLQAIFCNDIQYKVFFYTLEGPSVLLLVNQSPENLKEVAISVEDNYTLGKCIDIEVYDYRTKKLITREMLGVHERYCMICGNIKESCIKENRHTQDDVIRYINKTYLEYIYTFYEREVIG